MDLNQGSAGSEEACALVLRLCNHCLTAGLTDGPVNKMG